MLFQINDPEAVPEILPKYPELNAADILNSAQAYKEMESSRIKALERMTSIVDKLLSIKQRLESISGDASKVHPVAQITTEFTSAPPFIVTGLELINFTNYDLRTILLPKVNAAIQSTLRRIRDEVNPDEARPLL